MIETKLFKQDIAIQAILYIVKQMGGKCDIHKCHKILYFADNEHLSKYGRSIIGDTYVRMDFGPVPTCIYDLFKAVHHAQYADHRCRDDNNTRRTNPCDNMNRFLPFLGKKITQGYAGNPGHLIDAIIGRYAPFG